jgi:hypothetical protein
VSTTAERRTLRRVRRVAAGLLAMLVCAASATAHATVPAQDGGPELGAARVGAMRMVPKASGSRGPLNPGRAARLLARELRVGGDQPRRVACAMRTRDEAACRLVVMRGGVRWTGEGAVRQQARAFRVSYDLSAGGDH